MAIDIYTKTNCPYCVKAKGVLTNAGYSYKEYIIGAGPTKEDIQKRINSMGLTIEIKTIPQIFYVNKNNDSIYIGGYTDLLSKLHYLNNLQALDE